MKAQLEAVNQMRGMFNERFSTISEQIGELRTMIVSQEQEFSDLEVRSEKASEIMSQLEPEKFLSEMSKFDMKIEALKGKMESSESVNQMIMKELKDQRQKMALFKGIEDTIKLNQEVREELMGIKKIESVVDVHANKVESMFMQVQKRFNEFEKFKGMAEDMQAAFLEQKQEFDNMKVKFTEFIGKSEVDAQKDEFMKIVDNFERRVVNIEKIATSMEQLVKADKFKLFREQNLRVLKEHQKGLDGLSELRAKIDGLIVKSEKVDIEKLKEFFVESKEVKDIENDLENLRTIMTYGFKRVQQMEGKMFVEKETFETIRQIIQKYLEKGYTKEQIAEAFEVQGWPRKLIKQYMEI